MAQLMDAIETGPNQEMRELIRIPFNLRLLGELIGEGLALEEITPMNKFGATTRRIFQIKHRRSWATC